MSERGTWIRGALLVDPRGRRPADVLVRGERIAAIVPRDAAGGDAGPGRPEASGDAPATGPGIAAPSGAGDVDGRGLWLLPGGVDGHVHFGMPLAGGLRSLGWRPSSEAALLGGTTTVVDFANPEPGEPLAAAVRRWRATAAADCLCDFGLHATFSEAGPERLAELDELLADGVCTFKAFLAYPGRLMLSRTALEGLMAAIASRGARLVVHAEDGPTCAAAERALLDTGRTAPVWHPAAHPPGAELDAVAAALAMALRTGCDLTLAHLSLGGSVERLRRARAEAAARPGQLAGEVCLHHLLLDESLYGLGPESALRATLSPPLRPAPEAAALVAALAAGDLDLLATDHCEFPLAVKRERARHGFAAVPNGAGGVGERLCLSHGLAVADGRLSAERWVEACCEAPARLLGLADRKGRLAPGLDADLVLFDPTADGPWEPAPACDPAASLWSGRPCRGRVRDVMLRGRWVVRGGRLLPDLAPGRYLPRALAG